MAGVNAEISLSIRAQQIGSADLGSPRMTLDPISEILQFTQGTDATSKLNVLFSDTRTIALSANEDLDLSGVLTDALGGLITAAEVCAIFVKADAANINSVNVSRPAANGFIGPFLAAGDGISVKPGEYALLSSPSGWAVTAGTGDLLNIANSGAGTAVSYDIVILGRTAAA